MRDASARPPGGTGEIRVCGPAVLAGYHDDAAANAAFRDEVGEAMLLA